jgi:hypothetical protein
MEKAVHLSYREHKRAYQQDRVFNTMCGHRVAEPSSVTVVATHCSLTRLLLRLADTTRAALPGNRVVHQWQIEAAAAVVARAFRRFLSRRRIKNGDFARVKYASSSTQSKLFSKGRGWRHSSQVVLNASDGCIRDMKRILASTLLPNMARIVGADAHRQRFENGVHTALVKQGERWAEHVNEPWNAMLLAALYITLSVMLGLPVFLTSAQLLRLLLNTTQAVSYSGAALSFSFFDLPVLEGASAWLWLFAGFVARALDAWLYIFCAKFLARGLRWSSGRNLWARMGKRTLVLVETDMNHRLLESFVSKLFAESYGFRGLDVHGASGLDHFVHEFTHRVARGVLLAVGRPDGRLTCLARSEHAVLLSIKQAAFVQNAAYPVGQGGPEICCLGHNPFTPNLPMDNVILPSDTRRTFADEVVFRYMSEGQKPSADKAMHKLTRLHLRAIARLKDQRGLPLSGLLQDDVEPYGVHHLDPSATFNLDSTEHSLAVSRHRASFSHKTEPAEVLAFSHQLDHGVKQAVVENQVMVQRFYECRIASLERFVGFCVLFSAMADKCCSPLFCQGWDTARSQSNLSVATTAAPVSADDTASKESGVTRAVMKVLRRFAMRSRGFRVNL